MNRKLSMAIASLALLSSVNLAHAANGCLTEPYDATKGDVDTEFGPINGGPAYIDGVPYYVSENTECAAKTSGAKVVLQVDGNLATKYDAVANKPATAFWLSTRKEMLRNYAVQGMTIGKDVEVVVVLSTVGATLAVKSHARLSGANADPANYSNPFISEIKAALDSGIKIYVCQTAARALGIKAEHLVDPRIKFVPGGHIAVSDFQEKGYSHLMYK